jgi:hypothetical protein
MKAAAKVRRRNLKPEPLTYAQMMRDQSTLVTLGQLKPQTYANRATALRLFLRANHVQLEDVVGIEMGPHFPLCVDNLVSLLRREGRNDRSITNTRSALKPWKLAVIADEIARALQNSQPTPFVSVLLQSIGKYPRDLVARQAGVPRSMFLGWLTGKMPRASNARYVRRIESFFGLESGSLVALAGISDGARARENVGEAHTIAYRENLGARSRSEYYLVPPLNSPLREQWRQLIRYKTAPVPTLKRSPAGRWTFSPLQAIRESDANWSTFLDGVEVPTAKPAWAQVAAFLGWMGLPTERGGLGMEKDTLQTLAWLAVSEFVEQYLEWLKQRCGGKRTKSTAEFFSLVSCLVRPAVGFLYQQPAMILTLSERFHSEDWFGMCQRQHAYIEQLKAAFKSEIVMSRDPFEPIQSMLDLPQPMEAIADMVQRMRRDRPTGCATSEAIWARDVLMVKLFVSNPLRLRNMATLTWTGDNVDGRRPGDKACLYQKGDGSWWLSVPKRLLKNRRGEVIHDYNSPVHNSVWGDLERYLRRHRDQLVRWPTDLVFLQRVRDPSRTESVRGGNAYKGPAQSAHRPFMEMSRRLVVLTRKYLWKSNGIGAHSMRHIVATSILKTASGDIKTAALVLNDAEATVAKHYSGMRSGDGAVRMGELLGKTFDRM